MAAYYNENNAFAAAWLRLLISKNLIAPGDVDERSIEDVRPSDLTPYTQCHFFAGIGGWSYALKLAGWPDDRPVWTGSCPCQPFSAAGKGKGFADERHFWPSFYHLIEQSGPPTVFGEQVASKDGLAWLDVVQTDLEAQNYAFAALDLCAAGFGAPHIRQRLYFVADSQRSERRPVWERRYVSEGWDQEAAKPRGNSPTGSLANLSDSRRQEAGEHECGSSSRGSLKDSLEASWPSQNSTNGFWSDADWLPCRDGKVRPVEPGTFPLAHGVSNRVGRLRGYGNAIVAPQAQAFIEAYMECCP